MLPAASKEDGTLVRMIIVQLSDPSPHPRGCVIIGDASARQLAAIVGSLGGHYPFFMLDWLHKMSVHGGGG